jgi:hypothetical protein
MLFTQGANKAHGLGLRRGASQGGIGAPDLAASPPEEAAAAAAEREEQRSVQATAESAAEKKAERRQKRREALESRKVLFVHVRLNRVHCRVTYQARGPCPAAQHACVPPSLADAGGLLLGCNG